MEIVWTHRAKERLKGIHKHIAADQPSNADAWANRIIERVEILVDHPFLGRVVPEFESSDIREILEGNYRIIYLLSEHRIGVLTVRHVSQLLPAEISEMG